MYRIRTVTTIGRFVMTFAAVVVVQGVLPHHFRVFSYFDLPLVLCVYYGFTLNRPGASILIGSALGLMQDSLSGAVMGTNGFSKTLIGFLAASAGGKFNVDQPIARVLALFLFSLADGLVVSMLALVVGDAAGPAFDGAYGARLLSAAFNTLLGLVMLGYHDRLSHATT